MVEGPGARPGLTTCSYILSQPTIAPPSFFSSFFLSSFPLPFSLFPFSLSQSAACIDHLLYTSLDNEVGMILITKCSLNY